MAKSYNVQARVMFVLAAFLCVAALKYGLDYFGVSAKAGQSVSGGLQRLMSGVH